MSNNQDSCCGLIRTLRWVSPVAAHRTAGTTESPTRRNTAMDRHNITLPFLPLFITQAQWLSMIIVGVLLSGCAAVDTAQSAIGLYDSARSVTTGYHAVTSVKDLQNAKPLFREIDSVLVLADIQPRDAVPELPAAFAENLASYTTAVAASVKAPIQVCRVMVECSGRILILNFVEDAYDRNLIQRLTVGDKIRGKLVFTDAVSGQILDEKRAEIAEDYAGLARQVSGFVMGSLYKSFPPTTDADGERVGKAISQIPVVAPEYERVLGKAR
ncbi:hypothetical protein [Nevskia sp.]|uniref:hypothetical protein n=1 Tax=Nevskia sp. TaxID=1929292 RepID=UPI0025E93B48|nr:hypothetical protein [Nevskia sp.]